MAAGAVPVGGPTESQPPRLNTVVLKLTGVLLVVVRLIASSRAAVIPAAGEKVTEAGDTAIEVEPELDDNRSVTGTTIGLPVALAVIVTVPL
jgi:hypothetical protein